MKDKLIRYFSRFTTLSAEEQQALTGSMIMHRFSKGSLILREGQYHTDTYFVVEGLVRQYRVVEDAEITTGFFAEDDWIISLTGFTGTAPSATSLVCMEDTVLVVGNEERAQEIFRRFPRLETISRAVMETVFAAQTEYMQSLMTDTAGQRYRRLLGTRPSLLQRVPQYYIASYIGVQPETLSRIRRRIGKES